MLLTIKKYDWKNEVDTMKKDKNPTKKNRNNPNDPHDNDDWITPRPFRGFGFFDEFEVQFKRMEQQMNTLFKQMINENLSSQNDANTQYYGWTYQVGPDGKPHYQEFGNIPNIHSSQPKPQLQQRYQSPIDIQESDKEIYITMELPGIEKENIKLETIDTILKIEINDDDQPYKKEIDLKTKINEKKTEATLNNGILCITLEKLKTKKKGRKINIK